MKGTHGAFQSSSNQGTTLSTTRLKIATSQVHCLIRGHQGLQPAQTTQDHQGRQRSHRSHRGHRSHRSQQQRCRILGYIIDHIHHIYDHKYKFCSMLNIISQCNYLCGPIVTTNYNYIVTTDLLFIVSSSFLTI